VNTARDPATVGATARRIRRALAEAGVDAAEVEARRLVGGLLGLDPTGLVVRSDLAIDAAGIARLDDWLGRRLAGEPVERILGFADFFGRRFALSAETLVPRPDTETLVVATLDRLDRDGVGRPVVADLGVGSGAILVTLLAERPEAVGLGTDLSRDALATARANADALGVGARALLVAASFSDSLAPAAFDAIVSNPPYIETAEIAGLDREVRLHDPALALDGGADGLSAYRVIVDRAPAGLKDGGRLLVEIGWRQGRAVAELFERAGLGAVEILPDLAGRDRVVAGRKGGGDRRIG
jgi:release factor glutamine methyltransferase